MDALFEGVYNDDPMPLNAKDEQSKEVTVGGSWETTKRRITLVDCPLAGDVSTSTIGKRLRNRRNMDLLLVESDVFITIPDNDASYLSEGMEIEATEPPLEPKDEPKDVTDLGDGESGRRPKVDFQITTGFALSPTKGNNIAGASPSTFLARDKWTLTCRSLLTQH